MKVIPHPKLPSQMLLGYRVASETGDLVRQEQVQQVLVVIVKGTFTADDPTATPLPVEQQIPIFLQDVFFNAVKNPDFRQGEQKDSEGNVITSVSFWMAEGPTISQLKLDDAGTSITVMRVVGIGGVTQALTFASPLGNRAFTLEFRAKASANVTISSIQVKSKSGEVLLDQSYSLSPNFQVFKSLTHTWSRENKDTEATLILQGASGVTIDYDYVQLVEGSTVFPFDRDNPNPICYEHDLATYKPLTDIVVLGQPAPLTSPPPSGVGPIGTWVERVQLGSDTMTDNFTKPVTQPFTFGWQSRIKSARTGYAGFFGSDGTAFDPSTMKLPKRFNNLFFNGGLYRSADSPPRPVFSHPLPGAKVTVESTATYQVGSNPVSKTATRTLHLPQPGPRATLTYRSSSSADAPIEQVALPLAIDTIVYDKNSNRFYVVWRGFRLIQQEGSSPSLPLARLVSLKFF